MNDQAYSFNEDGWGHWEVLEVSDDDVEDWEVLATCYSAEIAELLTNALWARQRQPTDGQLEL